MEEALNLNNNSSEIERYLSALVDKENKKFFAKKEYQKEQLTAQVRAKQKRLDVAQSEFDAFKAKEKARLNMLSVVTKKFNGWEESSKEFMPENRQFGLIKKASDYFVDHFINAEHFSELNLKIFVQNTNLTLNTIKKLENNEDFNSIAQYLVGHLGNDTGRFNLILNDVVVFADGENAIDFYKQYSHKYAKSHNQDLLDRAIETKRAVYNSESEEEKGE